MIQFNLLPLVKLEYAKAQRTKRLTFLIAGSFAALGVLVLVSLFVVVNILQKNHSEKLSKDIKTETTKLQSVKDIDKILTIQNQLTTLTTLHDEKPVATRLFSYLKQLTPSKATIASLNQDFATQTINFTGSTDNLTTINQFIDTLKFTNYKVGDTAEMPAFSAVVLTAFGRTATTASYQISFKYDPAIFIRTNDVKLIVPAGKITTRSETEKPASLFDNLTAPLPATEQTHGGNR